MSIGVWSRPCAPNAGPATESFPISASSQASSAGIATVGRTSPIFSMARSQTKKSSSHSIASPSNEGCAGARADTSDSNSGQGSPQRSRPPSWAEVDVRGLRVERVRDFGAVYLALALWRRLGLHTILGRTHPPRPRSRWLAHRRLHPDPSPASAATKANSKSPSAGIKTALWKTSWV